MRTHTCGALRKTDLGATVTLCGWVDTVRDHGGVIFIDLRDRYGVTQMIFDPNDAQDAWNVAQSTRGEYVIQATGTVEARPAEMANPKLATGEIEVRCIKIAVLNKSKTTPFPLDDKEAEKVSEDLRLTYRYLDLRRPRMQRNLQVRHAMTHSVRSYLDEAGFTEVETPILTKSTPEGARDYLVPSRVMPGSFYALPQAPQQYKQLLMMAGVDRYFQMARCFRDEDLRADRQPEFTQIDIEMSFITPEDIYALIDGLIAAVMEATGKGTVSLPLPRLTYDDAMSRYGSDKPDTRFGMELVELTDLFADTDFKVFRQVVEQGGVIKAVSAKGLGGVPIRVMDDWTAVAREMGLGGLAYVRAQEDGEWKSPIIKFFSDGEKQALAERMAMEPGDLVFFAADQRSKADAALGRLRLLAGEMAGAIDHDSFAFTWVTDFPLFDRNDEGRLVSVHHPFTAMHPEDEALLESDPMKIRAQAYDIVMNGVELGGGSIRIHDPEMQARIFRALQLPAEEIEDRFGHLLQALSFGAPPHGGVALGFDRFVMMIAGEDSIRDVIAFPKTQKAVDMMMHAPSTVDAKQLRDVHIKLDIADEE
jgi:aspartyl-tRNA synthetase